MNFFFDSNHPPPQAIKSPEAVVQAAKSELVLTNVIALKSEVEEQLAISPIANPVANVSDSSTTDIIDSAVRQLAICDRILSVAQAHQMTCAYTKLKREHLLEANATVTVAHSRTPDLSALMRQADILVAAVGRPGMVTAADIKPGSVVIDVGINRVELPDGSARLVGDVDFASVEPVAGAITPVPGGVGPMTVAMLLENRAVILSQWKT